MAAVSHIDIQGKVPDVGKIHFLRAEWWTSRPRFVLIRYSVAGKEEQKGMRLDLDKRAILDDVGDPATAAAVHEQADSIWNVVAPQLEDRAR